MMSLALKRIDKRTPWKNKRNIWDLIDKNNL
jgi:hypothetical protein